MPRKKPKSLRPKRHKQSRKGQGVYSKEDKFKSGLERLAAALFEKRGLDFEYEPEKVSYVLHCNYVPDFKINDIYIETKGLFDATDRRKMLAVKEQHPELDIRIWFSYDSFLTKAKKVRCSDWCKKHGFPFHAGDCFPKHWFE